MNQRNEQAPSRHWAQAALVGLSLLCGRTDASTLWGPAVDLDPQQAEILWATACNTYPQAINTHRSLGVEGGLIAEVQCSPHAEYQGQAVSLIVECARAGNQTQWQCRKAIPTIDLKLQDRILPVRYTFTSAAEVANIVEYLLTEPLVGTVATDADWLTGPIYVYGHEDFVSLSASRHSIKMVRQQRQATTHLRAVEIFICEVDVCHSLTDPRTVK